MAALDNHTFDTATFLSKAGLGRRIVQLAPRQTFFSQGDPADSVFYLQNGRAKVTSCFRNRQGSNNYACS
jgi:CRP-like cAMP-binding protein